MELFGEAGYYQRGMKRENKKSGDAALPAIQFSAKFQLPFSDFMQPPSPQFGNQGAPLAHGGWLDVENSRDRELGLEELNDIGLMHGPRITMLNLEVKNGFPAESYAVPMETMGDRIRMLRQARGLTQEQLGGRLGVSKVSVSQWETGSTSNIRLKTFLALCEELVTKPQYLIFGHDARPASPNRRSKTEP